MYRSNLETAIHNANVSNMSFAFSLIFLTLLLSVLPALAADHAPVALRVNDLQIASGLDVPADYVSALHDKVLEDLDKTKEFSAVRQQNPEVKPAFELNWTITSFDAGSRKKRILAGGYGRLFKVGATKMVVHAQIRDLAANELVLDRDVDGAETGNTTNPFNVTAGFKSSKAVVDVEAGKITDEIVKSSRDYLHKHGQSN